MNANNKTMRDLFEYYEDQPKNLKTICDHWGDIEASEGLTYEGCELFLKEVEKIGYTFDYGLDSQPFELRPMSRDELQTIVLQLRELKEKLFPVAKVDITTAMDPKEKELTKQIAWIYSQLNKLVQDRRKLIIK